MEILPDPTGFSAFESDCGFLGEPGELSSKNSRGSALGISPLRSLLAFFEESLFSAFELDCGFLGEPGELSSKNSRGSALGISPLRSLLAFFEESDFSAFALFLLILGGAAPSSPLLQSATF